MSPTATLKFHGSDLLFDADRHEYRLPDGRLVPNVTTILQATGVSTNFEEIAAVSSRLADKIDYRRLLGRAVHADCWAFDDDDLVWDYVHRDVKPYVEAWATFRENSRLVPVQRERRVFHPSAFYCGTLDGIFRDPESDHLVLIDIKIGDPFDAAAHLQTAAYAEAYLLDAYGDVLHYAYVYRQAVRLIPGRAVPYDVTPYPDWNDILTFKAVLTTYNQHPSRRTRG